MRNKNIMKYEDGLKSNLGVCTPDAILQIKPYREILDLGAAPDIFRAFFGAVHRANRHSKTGFAALSLPGSQSGYGIHALGDVLSIIGDETVLQTVLDDDMVRKLIRRDMFRARIRDLDAKNVNTGTYLVRDRRLEKVSTGGAARKARRDARRAAHIASTKGTAGPAAAKPIRLNDILGRGFMTYGPQRKLSFISGRAPYSGDEIKVNTYGMSIPSCPAVLPVKPESPV